jgi:hypothetical protein
LLESDLEARPSAGRDHKTLCAVRQELGRSLLKFSVRGRNSLAVTGTLGAQGDNLLFAEVNQGFRLYDLACYSFLFDYERIVRVGLMGFLEAEVAVCVVGARRLDAGTAPRADHKVEVNKPLVGNDRPSESLGLRTQCLVQVLQLGQITDGRLLRGHRGGQTILEVRHFTAEQLTLGFLQPLGSG